MTPRPNSDSDFEDLLAIAYATYSIAHRRSSKTCRIVEEGDLRQAIPSVVSTINPLVAAARSWARVVRVGVAEGADAETRRKLSENAQSTAAAAAAMADTLSMLNARTEGRFARAVRALRNAAHEAEDAAMAADPDAARSTHRRCGEIEQEVHMDVEAKLKRGLEKRLAAAAEAAEAKASK